MSTTVSRFPTHGSSMSSTSRIMMGVIKDQGAATPILKSSPPPIGPDILQEPEQVEVDLVVVGNRHSVRSALVEF